MTDEQSAILVLRDAGGNYYLLTAQMIEDARVPEDRKGEIDHLIAGEDVAGFAFELRQAGQANTIANGMEILGIAWGGPTMIRGFKPLALGQQ
jgi:hypothetical protein